MSVLLPDTETAAGRRSAARRGFWGGVVIALISAAAPPPIGAISAVTFGLIALGIHLKHTWAARAGVIAAFAPIVSVVQLPDSGLIFGAFFQCFIAAYFFYNGWRGLRAEEAARPNPPLLRWSRAIFWLALGLAFVAASYFTTNRFPVPPGPQPAPLMAGDWVLIRPLERAAQPGDIVLVALAQPEASPAGAAEPQPAAAAPTVLLSLHQVMTGETVEPKSVLGAARWILWSADTTDADSPIAFYTKARWGRFPQRIR